MERIGRLADFKIDEWDEDGLGLSKGLCVRLSDGPVVSLTERRHGIDDLGARGPTVECAENDVALYGNRTVAARALQALGLDASAVQAIAGQRKPWLMEKSARRMARRILAEVSA